jgi:hypothetical protein
LKFLNELAASNDRNFKFTALVNPRPVNKLNLAFRTVELVTAEFVPYYLWAGA